MPFEDFTKRSWIITKSYTPCTVKSIVLFAGPRTDVVVTCNGAPYPPGTYYPKSDKGEERIEAPNAYSIVMLDTKPKLTLVASFVGVVGGSWTAEDTASSDSGG
jgi:hypothetical protein